MTFLEALGVRAAPDHQPLRTRPVRTQIVTWSVLIIVGVLVNVLWSVL